MVLTKEQEQTRFLAIVLPTLTFFTHTLLALSSALPGTEQYRAFWSLIFNVIAAGASVLGLVGAVRLVPSFVSAYTLTHTASLSFVTLALLNIILPFDAGFLNPVIPSWSVDESSICRDIDAGLGWDEEWLAKCSMYFNTTVGQGDAIPEIEGKNGRREDGVVGSKHGRSEGRKDTILRMDRLEESSRVTT
ncbi:hypothetical protein DE146DRAFT_675694 [Phaeosphaeria sp. MPI-PUGE-AT-0046c]|nr:hypothetical protein DE146DRAFT_675694 [Phaeosphaeria sp. MPI-PUGE-AT-0046c]